jgi:uncharacterized protein YbjT (DUF2867 family)
MKVLIAGANGYIGTRLIPILLEKGHDLVCLVLQGDLLHKESIETFPKDIEAAYYLVHSMSQNENFAKLEAESAQNFVEALDKTKSKQVIFLSGITNDDNLSQHLQSRRHVEDVLEQAKAPLTVLRASIIIGSGSASFEIIRDLTRCAWLSGRRFIERESLR